MLKFPLVKLDLNHGSATVVVVVEVHHVAPFTQKIDAMNVVTVDIMLLTAGREEVGTAIGEVEEEGGPGKVLIIFVLFNYYL